MEQRRKALEKVSWEEMMKKLRGLFSQLSRRALPLGPELHKYTRNGFYTERGNEMWTTWVYFQEFKVSPNLVVVTLSVVSDSLWPYRLYPTRLLCPCDLPGKNTTVGYHFLHRDPRYPGVKPRGRCLLHWQADALPLSHQGSPNFS